MSIKLRFIYPLPLILFLSFNVLSASNSIDATTSASRKYKISGGEVKENSATINWSSVYSNGTLDIKWGTSSSQLSNTKNMYPYRRGSTAEITLSNLKPGTKYYYKVVGTYHGKSYNNLMSGSFTTTKSSAVSISSINTTSNVKNTISVSNNKLFTNLMFLPGDQIFVYDSRGALKKQLSVSSFQRNIDISFLGKGHHVIKLIRANQVSAMVSTLTFQ